VKRRHEKIQQRPPGADDFRPQANGSRVSLGAGAATT
jgi:hypothetical protein